MRIESLKIKEKKRINNPTSWYKNRGFIWILKYTTRFQTSDSFAPAFNVPDATTWPFGSVEKGCKIGNPLPPFGVSKFLDLDEIKLLLLDFVPYSAPFFRWSENCGKGTSTTAPVTIVSCCRLFPLRAIGPFDVNLYIPLKLLHGHNLVALMIR